MTERTSATTQRAIIHVDGDGFFAACEVAKDPTLKGWPVVVGADRGIALALTYEAKALGIRRGMRISEIRNFAPEAVILPSDFKNYTFMSARMNNIVRRYTTEVEEYSIDECFADITEVCRLLKKDKIEIAKEMKEVLGNELSITFSLGLAPTKVLAKIASNFEKPNGFNVIHEEQIDQFIAKIPIKKVWGVGRRTTEYLRAQGISTAQQFAQKDITWVRSRMAKPYQNIWRELHGEPVMPLEVDHRTQQSIMRTRTFTPPSRSKERVLAELIKNVEIATMRARQAGLVSKKATFFLKTQSFQFRQQEIILMSPANTPERIIKPLLLMFESIWARDNYRATGVTLSDLSPANTAQLDLFGEIKNIDKLSHAYEVIDNINRRYDADLIHLLASTNARNHEQSMVPKIAQLTKIPFAGEIN